MKSVIVAGSLFAATLVSSLAHAETDQIKENEDAYSTAPVRAFELSIANGFSQGFGSAAHDALPIGDLSSGGFSTQLGLGYRVNPRWAFGGYVEGSRFFSGNGVPDGTVNYSAAAGAQVQWHLLPFARLDPWVGLGTGIRAYWVDRPHGATEAIYGVDILRLRVGADYKLGPSTSIGPVLGASVSTLLAYDDATTREAKDIESPGLSTFVFAGLQGRFEIGGRRVTADGSKNVASR